MRGGEPYRAVIRDIDQEIFPACAGVSLLVGGNAEVNNYFPRTRGGEPSTGLDLTKVDL